VHLCDAERVLAQVRCTAQSTILRITMAIRKIVGPQKPPTDLRRRTSATCN